MNKHTGLIGLIIFILLSAIPFGTQASIFNRPLSIGATGSDVSELQSILESQGFYTYPSITGYYGSATTQAVNGFQKANGLEPLGIVGPATRALLNGLSANTTASTSASTSLTSSSVLPSVATAFTRDLDVGASGSDVSALQTWLIAQGYLISAGATGYFGAQTRTALVAYQTAHAISPAVGYFGPLTRGSVAAHGSAAPASPIPQTISTAQKAIAPGVLLAPGISQSGGEPPSHHVAANQGPAPDTTAPTLSAGAPSNTLSLNTTSTTLSLTTDEAATCAYSTSPGTAYASMTAFDTTGGTSHSTVVSGLTNGGSYLYYVKCEDTSANVTPSDYSISFTVAADTTSPTVSLTAPANNAIIAGTVSLTANASDDVSVAGVEFYVNGVQIGSEDTVAPYTVDWDSTATSSGAKLIVAVARDNAGNVATSSALTVTLDNGIVYTNFQGPYGSGAYSAYAGFWQLYNDPTLGLGHTAVEGVDYVSQAKIFTSTFPNGVQFTYRTPNLISGSGVYGYLHDSYGDYDGEVPPTPITPWQVFNITTLTSNIDFTIEGDQGTDILNEFYLTTAPHATGDLNDKLFEIGVFAHAPTQAQNFVNTQTHIGTFTDSAGKIWSVQGGAPDPQGAAYITFVHSDFSDATGTIYWKDMLNYLISQNIITGNEYFNGMAIGPEPNEGTGTDTISTFSVNYAGSNHLPATISNLSVSAQTTTSFLLAFSNALGATSYQYRINGGTATSLPTNKTVTAAAGNTIEVRGVNTFGNGDWSNVVTAPTPRMVLDFVNGSYATTTSYGSFTTYLSASGSTFSRSGAGGYDLALTQLFSNNVARITSAGLLLEPASTNYIIQSQYGGAAWNAQQVTLTANATTSPLGTATAATIKEDSSNNQHQVVQYGLADSVPAGSSVIHSVYAKKGTGAVRSMQLFDFSSDYGSQLFGSWKLATGANNYTSSPSTAFGSPTVFSTSVGSSYRRYSVAAPTLTSDTSFTPLLAMQDDSQNSTYTGDGATTLDVFGQQFEVGSTTGWYATHPSSYIPTTSSSATRGADTVSLTLPSGVSTIVVTFDDNSTQEFDGVTSPWTIPVASLNRPQIKTIVGI